jgi:HD domain
MPSIEIKSIDRVGEGDRLLMDAGAFARAGSPVDERSIRHLGRHRVRIIPTLALTYEESRLGGDENATIEKFLKARQGPWETVRGRIYEKLKSCYVPFSESDHAFQAPGKRKQIVPGVLLEPRPERLYLDDIAAGSGRILPDEAVRYLRDGLNTIFAMLVKLTVRSAETRGSQKRIPRLGFFTIRMQSRYDGERLVAVGDAHIRHALDSACYFLSIMININKKRIISGAPLTERRFDPSSTASQDSLFQYSQEFIVDAALGILLHALGFAHQDIHRVVSTASLIDGESVAEKRRIRLIQRNILVSRNLLRERHDISAISRMMLLQQHSYPDGTGFPPPNENKYLHEFVRLFHIVAAWDEMTNPATSHTPFSRMDVLDYLRDNAGEYRWDRERFSPGSRFDSSLLEEFLQIIAPWQPGEKVYLYNGDRRNAYLFVGRVHSYLDQPLPLISILKDERSGKSYPFGRLLFHLPSSTGFFMDGGKAVKKMKAEWIGRLRIHDLMINPGSIGEYQDLLYGSVLPLAKGVRS